VALLAAARSTAALAPRPSHGDGASLTLFRYLLELENGEPADPAMFVTAAERAAKDARVSF
jgi:hypothetical protein